MMKRVLMLAMVAALGTTVAACAPEAEEREGGGGGFVEPMENEGMLEEERDPAVEENYDPIGPAGE